MKNVKSFEYRIGWGGEDKSTNEVNSFLRRLNEKGITDVEINITSTGHGVMYTLIWEEAK